MSSKPLAGSENLSLSSVSCSQPASSYSSDEIDLRELILVLWRSRYLIVLITVIVTAIAAAYAYMSTPVYQSQARALPPAAAGLAAYNNAYRMSGPAVEGVVSNLNDAATDRLMGEAIPALSPDKAYQHFVRHIMSSALRREFFEAHFLPAQGFTGPVSDAQYEQLWKQFSAQLSVTRPTRDNEHVTVTLQGESSRDIAELVNLYVEQGIRAAQNELASNLNSALSVLHNSMDDQMASLRTGARQEREQHIVRLSEALRLAESIGLDKPTEAGNLITSYSGETTYMRGADALRSEITLLKNRVSDDPFIPELRDVMMRKSLLQSVDVVPQDIAVARIDEIAVASTTPIKPRKALILALGLVLGGMLGVFVVLVRNMFRN